MRAEQSGKDAHGRKRKASPARQQAAPQKPAPKKPSRLAVAGRQPASGSSEEGVDREEQDPMAKLLELVQLSPDGDRSTPFSAGLHCMVLHDPLPGEVRDSEEEQAATKSKRCTCTHMGLLQHATRPSWWASCWRSGS